MDCSMCKSSKFLNVDCANRLGSFKFCCICEFSFWVSVYGKLLAFDMCCIMFHSFCFHSGESVNKWMHVMKYLYAAILCSVGRFEKKLIVVSVLLGLWYMSTLLLDLFVQIVNLKKLFFHCFYMLD